MRRPSRWPARCCSCSPLLGWRVLVAQQRRHAITDALTGLHTRRFLEGQLPLELSRAERNGGGAALLIIDVDRFKSVNDSNGHPAGYRALIEIARRLRCGARTGDLLSRYGSEEFALLMPGAGADQLAAVVERLRAAVRRAPISVLPEVSIGLTVSVGAAAYPDHGRSGSELIEVADRALYTARQWGRDRTVIGPAEPCLFPDLAEEVALQHLVRLAEQVDELQSRAGRSRAVGRWSAQLCTELSCAPHVVYRGVGRGVARRRQDRAPGVAAYGHGGSDRGRSGSSTHRRTDRPRWRPGRWPCARPGRSCGGPSRGRSAARGSGRRPAASRSLRPIRSGPCRRLPRRVCPRPARTLACAGPAARLPPRRFHRPPAHRSMWSPPQLGMKSRDDRAERLQRQRSIAVAPGAPGDTAASGFSWRITGVPLRVEGRPASAASTGGGAR